jgi:RimJ/RimL family protein N-acetyltransferase
VTETVPNLHFQLLSSSTLTLLLAGDLHAAGREVGLTLPEAFLHDTWLWQIRLDQMREDPASAPWLARATVRSADSVVVGRAGFHGPPDERGMVEIGYEVQPEFRRQKYGLATAKALIDEAARNPVVTVVRASISPDNEPSLAIARRLGFVQVGEQMDEIDGLELVFELPLLDR